MGVFLGTNKANNLGVIIEEEDYYTSLLIDRTIDVYINDTISFIGKGAFQYCDKLTYAECLQCIYVDEAAFSGCESLLRVSFHSQCSYIGSSAFMNCYSLTVISFPKCEYVGERAFMNCYSLTAINFPNCSYIGSSAFRGCSYLTSATFSNCNYIGNYAFYSCRRLISLNLIETSSVPILQSTVAFNSTPIGGYSYTAERFGNIYVPSSLYNSFLTATNWSMFSSRMISV